MDNRAHSKIDDLPDELHRQVDEKLLAGETYQGISDYLAEQGEDVHYSSIGRYGRKYLKKFEAVRIAKEYAKLLAEDSIERPPTELHEANNMLMSQIIMESILDDNMSSKEKAAAARSIATLQRAQIQNEKLKADARKDAGAVHTAMELFKDKVFAEIGASHPDIADALIELAEQTESEMQKMSV
ncbi:MAG: DUF3486 family protein [Lachnospiraceae bacterium]|nr:DUF3486 family protein [Lachnospiraceae bacterium]MBR1567539.1 DUF3486 family protein [Lachnospiraceae bacterium]MBR1568695.1 DUF3486 family protein [Lachnospiraceae bacterium]